MGRIVELFADVTTVLFCLKLVPTVAFVELFQVEFVVDILVELVSGSPIGVNVMWMMTEPFAVSAGNVMFPSEMFGTYEPLAYPGGPPL